AREAYRLVVAGEIGAQEANGRAAGATADCFDFGGILDAVSCADVEVISPRDAIIGVAVTDLDARMAFWRIASRHGVIVDVGVVNGAIGVDRDRRIGALDRRGAARDDELLPSYASICAQRAALVASAVTDWQPAGSVRPHTDLTMPSDR